MNEQTETPLFEDCILRYIDANRKTSAVSNYFVMDQIRKETNFLNFDQLDMIETDYYKFIRSYIGLYDIGNIASNLNEVNEEELIESYPLDSNEIKKILTQCNHSTHKYVLPVKKFNLRNYDDYLKSFDGKFCLMLPANIFLEKLDVRKEWYINENFSDSYLIDDEQVKSYKNRFDNEKKYLGLKEVSNISIESENESVSHQKLFIRKSKITISQEH